MVGGGWGRLVRELGQSWLDVLRAELAALEDDFARSGRHLRRGLGLFGGAAALGFWAVGALVVAAIATLGIWLPLWASALIVAFVFAAAAAGLALQGKKSVEQVENPVGVSRRRLEDHMDWVQSRLLSRIAEEAEGEPGRSRKGGRQEAAYDDFEEELP